MTDHAAHGTVGLGEGCDALWYARQVLAEPSEYPDADVIHACTIVRDQSPDGDEQVEAAELAQFLEEANG